MQNLKQMLVRLVILSAVFKVSGIDGGPSSILIKYQLNQFSKISFSLWSYFSLLVYNTSRSMSLHRNISSSTL